MSTIARGSTDQVVVALKAALDDYEADHPDAKATLYRQNSGAVRIRIIDPAFAGQKRSFRHDSVWSYLEEKVDADALQEISILLLVPPTELATSLANMDFENPIPSNL